MVNILFLISLFVLLPLGEVTRYQFTNGTAVSLFDIAALLNLLTICVVGIKERKHIQILSLYKPLGIFIGVCILSLLINVSKLPFLSASIAALYIVRFTAYASFYVSISFLSKKILHHIPFFILLAGILIGIFGIIQFFLYPTLQNLYYLGWDRHWYRLFATFFDPNFAGVVLLFPFFFSLFLVYESFVEKKYVNTFLYSLATVFFILSVYLTFSRTALLALFAGLIVFFFFKKTSRKITLGIFGLLTLGITIISFNYKATEGTKLYRVASSEARIDSMNEAIAIFTKSPILGIGFNAYRYAQKEYGYATGSNWETSHSGAGTDNSLLFVLATTGIIGSISFLYLFFRIGKNVFLSSLPVATPIMSSIIALAVGSLFINAFFYPAVMFLFWSSVGIIDYTSQ